jgi:hypothetical protein
MTEKSITRLKAPKRITTGGEWVRTEEATLSEINANRAVLRALAEAHCPKEGRILAAVYLIKSGYWLWHVTERLTRQEVQRERRSMAAMEYSTMIENGSNPTDAWEHCFSVLLEKDDQDVHPQPSQTRVYRYGDPAAGYRNHSIDDISDDPPHGVFSSCGSCRLTYFVSHPVMSFAAGKAIETRAKHPVVVHPGRVVVVHPEDQSAKDTRPVYGFDPPWRPSAWRIVEP